MACTGHKSWRSLDVLKQEWLEVTKNYHWRPEFRQFDTALNNKCPDLAGCLKELKSGFLINFAVRGRSL